MKLADSIRKHVLERDIEPARRRSAQTVTVVAGEVHRKLGLKNRVPAVCRALDARRFLKEHHLELIKVEGPEASTTTTFTYRLRPEAEGDRKSGSAVWELLGAGVETFAALGGGEQWLREEREAFRTTDADGTVVDDTGRQK